jgi:hypothetical protein
MMKTTRMKLITVSIISWAACLVTVLAAIFVSDDWTIGVPDLVGAASVTLVTAAVAIALLYAPGLFWLRRRQGGCKPVVWFPLASALVFNSPIFLITALMAGKSLVVAEAFIFMAAFLVLGAAFGLGFVWTYREESFP